MHTKVEVEVSIHTHAHESESVDLYTHTKVKVKVLICTHSHKSESEVAQSCLTLCDPVDCSPPGSFIHGILQARILEWVATSFSRGSSRPRDRTQVSCIAGRHFNLWATREAMHTNQSPNTCVHVYVSHKSLFSLIRMEALRAEIFICFVFQKRVLAHRRPSTSMLWMMESV